MKRALGRLEQIADVVEAEARSEGPKVPCADNERRLLGPASGAARQRDAQALVDHGPERFPGATDFGLQALRHVLIDGQCRPHIVMLANRHHDVKLAD